MAQQRRLPALVDAIARNSNITVIIYLNKLSKFGILITASNPVENIPNYPDIETIFDEIKSLPNGKLVDINKLSRQAGYSHSANIVLIGMASKYLPISEKILMKTIEETFSHKGEKIFQANQKAFLLGSQEGTV